MSIYITLIVGLIIALTANYFQKKEKEKELLKEIERKEKLKELIESQVKRTRLVEMDQGEFWAIIDKASKKGGNGNYYSTFIESLKSALIKKDLNELIEFDNTLNALFKNALNQDFLALTFIINKSLDEFLIHHLQSLFISRGQVFFAQESINPSLLIGKEFNEIVPISISQLIGEIYFEKSNETIPYIDAIDPNDIKGEKWETKELPSRYPELWSEFA